MNQQEVRRYIESYLAAFSTHIVESHPAFVTVKLPDEVDKDIGNRPFYWSWVEKMNIPPQPLILSFLFDEEKKPENFRGEFVHFGSRRLHQIFESTRKHGSFVCLFEQSPLASSAITRAHRSTPLTPWLCINVKISFICDKKRDCLLSLGINLHHLRMVDDFYTFLKRLTLSPAIPDYHYTLDRRLSLEHAFDMFNDHVHSFIATQDQKWAEEARRRLSEELEILEAYYTQLELDEKEKDSREKTQTDTTGGAQEPDIPTNAVNLPLEDPSPAPFSLPLMSNQQDVSAPVSLEEHRQGGGSILDFLRMNSIPETSKEKIVQQDWKSSSPQEEKNRRMAELKWQYEPRIDVQVINAGLFYLYNEPPL
ncbi:YqhG family protein [Brevibacillus ginsengisoli]|uniref:YqhG family protein n=1 Tax=Brevibacillus ginsengisoli TaxID=363854 RepID=UPI003CF215D3